MASQLSFLCGAPGVLIFLLIIWNFAALCLLFSSLYRNFNVNAWRQKLLSFSRRTHLIIESSLTSTASMSWSSSNTAPCCFCLGCESKSFFDIHPYEPRLAWRQTWQAAGPGTGASLVASMRTLLQGDIILNGQRNKDSDIRNCNWVQHENDYSPNCNYPW